MYGFFKITLYLAVAVGLFAFAAGQFPDQSWAQQVPEQTRNYLAIGSLVVLVASLVGRWLTRPEETGEWK